MAAKGASVEQSLQQNSFAYLARVASVEMPEQSTTAAVTTAAAAPLTAEPGFRGAIDFFFPGKAAGATIEPVPRGFSGCPVVRVVLPTGSTWALKRLPESCDAHRAVWLHRYLGHLRGAPLEWIPTVAAVRGESVCRDASGGLWEMLSWMPGRPQPKPDVAQRQAMIEAVAAVHARATTFPEQPAGCGVPPAWRDRIEQCHRLQQQPWNCRFGADAFRVSESGTTLRESPRLTRALATASRMLTGDGLDAVRRVVAGQPAESPLVVVLRDLTADHLLLGEDEQPGTLASWNSTSLSCRVTGLIDFHAARFDSPACDLARLLASWHAGLPTRAAIDEAVAWYTARPWDASFLRQDPQRLAGLVDFLTATSLVLGLDNWFRWLLEEQRWFPDPDAVLARVEMHVAALEEAFERLRGMPLVW